MLCIVDGLSCFIIGNEEVSCIKGITAYTPNLKIL